MSGFPSVYANPEISDAAGKIDIVLVKGLADNYGQWFYFGNSSDPPMKER